MRGRSAAGRKEQKMVDVRGKWALITGASRGIGKGIAVFMAKKGCNLILVSRDEKHCEGVLREVKKYGVESFALGCELSDESDVKRMLEEIDRRGKQVDIIFNNAAITATYMDNYWETDPQDYVNCFKVNVVAPAMIMYHFLPKMEANGFGRIINTTSGIHHEPEQAAYSASKAALDKITMDLAHKYDGSDIIISVTDPGWCSTDLGGPTAPNAPESSLPGVVVGAFVDDKKSGRYLAAGYFYGMGLEEAVNYSEWAVPPYSGSTSL